MMIELSVIRDLVAIFGVIAGLTYYMTTVRNQNRTRRAQLYMQIFNRLSSLDFTSSTRVTPYLTSNRLEMLYSSRAAHFFPRIGNL